MAHDPFLEQIFDIGLLTIQTLLSDLPALCIRASALRASFALPSDMDTTVRPARPSHAVIYLRALDDGSHRLPM